MDYKEKYYKELFILKKTKDYVLDIIAFLEAEYILPNRYNYEELRYKANKLNTIFELELFSKSELMIGTENGEAFIRQLTHIQEGAFNSFFSFITMKPQLYTDEFKGMTYLSGYENYDCDINPKLAVNELIEVLNGTKLEHRLTVLYKILREKVAKASKFLNFINDRFREDSEKPISSSLTRDEVQSRLSSLFYFNVELIKALYFSFKIDIVNLIEERNLVEEYYIFHNGVINIENYKRFRDTIVDIEKGEASSEESERIIEDVQSKLSQTEYKNKAFTAPRQVLAIQSLLSELGVDLSSDNKTTITAFMQFLTGRQPDSIPKNAGIYKLVGKLDTKTNYNENCDFVAKQFESLGLNILAKKLTNGKNE